MDSSLISLDIETTGLDSQKDAILEIAAVRFKGSRLEGEYRTFVNPGRPVPPFITQLTGITDQMVRTAPSIREVIPDLNAFVGNLPIVGHNVQFDLTFLRRYKILELNDAIDTYEMAAVLLPRASRYNLGSLGQQLEIPLPATHRALDDARVTKEVFRKLYDLALQLPVHLLAELVRQSENLSWGAGIPFQQALRSRSKEAILPRQVRSSRLGPMFDAYESRNYPPLNPESTIYALDVDEVASILEYNGAFSQHFPNYEYRPQQVEMLRSVAEALSESHHLLVEAGTGTGKSMAYLIPAALWAMQNKTRVVISTNTINLQDQLVNKDIPDLRAALGVDLRATLVKGRSNYLCPHRLEALRRHGPQTPDEMRMLGKILMWLQETQTGDRSEININGPAEREIWQRLSAEDDACTIDRCVGKMGGNCPFYRMRQAAQSAHLLIVNHALLLADIATGSKVLPEYSYLIVDEAHHIEAATTNALSFNISKAAVERAIRELGGPKHAALGRTLKELAGVILPADYALLEEYVERITDAAYNFDFASREFFDTLEHFLEEQREGRPMNTYGQQERILPATRAIPAWTEVEVAWDEAEKPLRLLIENFGSLIKGIGQLNSETDITPGGDGTEDLFGVLSSIYRRFTEIFVNLNAMVFKPDNQFVYWVEANPNTRRIAINAAPLHIGPLMQKHIWNEKTAVILTSATLTAAGEFGYMRGRLQAEDAYEMTVGSPFDFENSALLYIANDIPEPSDRHGHQRATEQAILRLAQAAGGRTLALFTSYDQLKRTSQSISSLLAKDDIRLYEQGEGASAHSLLESFRADERAVLMGTRSFWEGVDVPGQALSVVVIAKLPFDVPTDPIIAARSETFEDPFNQYSLPEAILRFRQGFGRLIRAQTDRGMVVILDRRILTKRYGKLFTNSLPPCTVQVGSLADLPRTAQRWLNL